MKFLREFKGLSYAEIARLVNRDQRGIWCTHRRASKKHPETLLFAPSSHYFPVSLFTDRTLSILEHVVHHLREQNIPVKTIAQLINKSPSTIASVHHRVRRKRT